MFAQALRREWRAGDLSAADRAMLEYVEAVTKDPRTISASSLDTLRNAGFSDAAILQITMIAAWFNYINRMADALGVGRESPRRGAEEDRVSSAAAATGRRIPQSEQSTG